MDHGRPYAPLDLDPRGRPGSRDPRHGRGTRMTEGGVMFGGVVLIVFGLGVFAWQTLHWLHLREALSWPVTAASVASAHVHHSTSTTSSGRTRHHESVAVTYRYEAPDGSHTGQTTLPGDQPPAVGSRIDVRVDPADPTDVLLDAEVVRSDLPFGMLLAMGGVFMGCAMVGAPQLFPTYLRNRRAEPLL